MARVRATVGTEEHVRHALRDVLAARIESGSTEPFVLDLMDVGVYAGLIDESRTSMRKLLNGYVGAATDWKGVSLPTYRYDAGAQLHQIQVSYPSA
jgi:hypothetical protein